MEAKHESIGLLLLDALRAEIDCRKVDTYDACESRFRPIMSKIDAEGDLVIAQLAKVDECKKTYRTTIDKRTSDLTVRESTAVKACQALDLYPWRCLRNKRNDAEGVSVPISTRLLARHGRAPRFATLLWKVEFIDLSQ